MVLAVNDAIQITRFFDRPRLTKIESNHLYLGIIGIIVASILSYVFFVYARKWTKKL